VDTEDIVKIFNASRINNKPPLRRATHEGVKPRRRLRETRGPSRSRACGGFQLVDRRKGLDRFFRIGEEVECFGSLAELRGKIARYLADPEERAAIAERGRRRVLRDHTYERRMEEMIAF
jgi:spore maturation protein CgeB